MPEPTTEQIDAFIHRWEKSGAAHASDPEVGENPVNPVRAANLKPGDFGDLKVGWSDAGFSSKDSRQKSSFCLFFRAIAECPNRYSAHSGT